MISKVGCRGASGSIQHYPTPTALCPPWPRFNFSLRSFLDPTPWSRIWNSLIEQWVLQKIIPHCTQRIQTLFRTFFNNHRALDTTLSCNKSKALQCVIPLNGTFAPFSADSKQKEWLEHTDSSLQFYLISCKPKTQSQFFSLSFTAEGSMLTHHQRHTLAGSSLGTMRDEL